MARPRSARMLGHQRVRAAGKVSLAFCYIRTDLRRVMDLSKFADDMARSVELKARVVV